MKCKWVSRVDNNIKCEKKCDESGYCIFHKIDKNKEESELFLDKIRSEEISDFRGYIFNMIFNINEVIDYEYNKLDFSEAFFLKEANFSDYKFKKDISFNYAIFSEDVDFKSSVFISNCNFYKTMFNEKYIDKKIFEKVKFKGQNLIINNVKNFPRMDGILFSDCSKFILRDIKYDESKYLYGKINYRIARNQAKKIGNYETIGHYYYKERTYGSKIIKSSDYPTYSEYLSAKCFDILSKYSIGYGEKPWNILIITILIISVFAFLYMFVGIKTTNNQFIGIDINNLDAYSLKEIINIYVDLWYFSMVTFSTVGYGDMIVTTILGKVLTSIEVFFGVTIAATWASVVIKRMIR